MDCSSAAVKVTLVLASLAACSAHVLGGSPPQVEDAVARRNSLLDVPGVTLLSKYPRRKNWRGSSSYAAEGVEVPGHSRSPEVVPVKGQEDHQDQHQGVNSLLVADVTKDQDRNNGYEEGGEVSGHVRTPEEVSVRGQMAVEHEEEDGHEFAEEPPEDLEAAELWSGVLWAARCLWGGGGGVVDCVTARSALVLDRLVSPEPPQDVHDLGFSGRKKKRKLHRHMKQFMHMMHSIIKLLMLSLPFLFFIKFKAVMLVSFAVGTIVLLAGKSLILAIVSFALSMVAALRSPAGTHHHSSDPFRREDLQLLEGGRPFFM